MFKVWILLVCCAAIVESKLINCDRMPATCIKSQIKAENCVSKALAGRANEIVAELTSCFRLYFKESDECETLFEEYALCLYFQASFRRAQCGEGIAHIEFLEHNAEKKKRHEEL